MPRGGVRVGAGRPKTTLAALVEAGTFDWGSRLHRRLLLEGDLPEDHPRLNRLEHIQRSYQGKWGVGPDAKALAMMFSSVVREGA